MLATPLVSDTPNHAEYHDYHLTLEQIAFFDENGYLILRNWIPRPLLTRLQAAATQWIDLGWQEYPADQPLASLWSDDFAFAECEHGRVMWRINYVHDKGQSASLELLGSPQVLAVAESLCGRNFVPTYESMVFKQEGDGKEVAWHQDAIHPRNHRIFNLDIYLDESLADGGALRVIPKSQQREKDHCELKAEHGWMPPGVVVVEMQPGDVLLHDVMIVHGSPSTEGNKLRRTLYYEFRAAEQILSEGPWDRTWIERRMRLIPLALHCHNTSFADIEPFVWNVDPGLHPAAMQDEETELKVLHVTHTRSAFCSAGDVPAKKTATA